MNDRQKSTEPNEFTQESEGQRIGLAAEFWDFLKHNKKWWLLPILIALAAMLALLAFVLFSGGAAAPFIYPLF